MKSLTRSLLSAAALSVLASGALAQTRVDRSGATDASNRVGSNGQNVVGGRENPWDISNRIVYGNVTGGKQFRGSIASRDPQAFRGNTGTRQFDNFVRDSSGVTTGGVPSYNANTTRAYYGDSRAVAPPAGFVGVTSTGGYSPPVPTAWRNVDPRIAPVSAAPTNTPLNAPGDTAVSGGELDTVYAPDAATAGQANITAGLSEYTTLNTSTIAQFTPSQIKQMQSDEPRSRLPGQTPANGPTNNTTGVDAQPQQITPAGTPVPTPGATGTTPNGTTPSGTTPTGPAGNAPAGAAPLGGTPESTFVPPTMLNNTVGGGTEVGTVTRLTPRAGQPQTPDKAGTADAAAADANAPQRPGQAAEAAARQFNADMKARKQAADAAKNADQPAPKAGDKPAPQPADAKPADKPAGPPAKVGTFAGVGAGQGLTDLMTKAEAQIKEGKYGSAIDTYSAAEAVAPRSAVLKLGRANAELGGAYYVRAANSLRQAFSADKNLLKSQYDLRAFLGDDRLQTAQKDLSDLVQNHANDTNAAVLLAYVYYNTGNERRAQALLDLADKRSNGRDALVKAMKAGWTFGADETK